MASSSSTIPQVKYDVFLSFKEEDTGDNFTSHLYRELCRKKLETFIDNEVNKGDEISPSLLNAIEQSKLSVVIFSKEYAYSKCCLEQLAKILECKSRYGQIVIPVFYHVDPSDVRKQIGTFAEAFGKLEENFKEKVEKLKIWRTALTEAANISGWDSRRFRSESLFVEEIVSDILKRLHNMSLSDHKDLISMDSRIKYIESLLSPGSEDVRMIGIWGIGGIGKTTLAAAVFNKILNQFEGSCFIHNVREESEKSGGLPHLRQELVSTILEDGNSNIGTHHTGVTFIEERLRRKKVLIVLDDVTQLTQIKFLIGRDDLKHCFGWGSRIVITTRDKQILNNCRVDYIVEVLGLQHHEALQLFSQYAFEKHHVTADYMELSNKVVRYADGVPLALKVLGSLLHGKNRRFWEKTLKKLEKVPHIDIKNVLKISYDGLDDDERNIFLDIVCFFKDEDRDFVTNILDASGFSIEIGISVLIDKSLIMISNNKIQMHDLIQEMGKEMVRQESNRAPGKRSRLWHHDDIYEILTTNSGTKTIEGISLDTSKAEEIHLNSRAFAKMDKLRFLIFKSSSYEDNGNKVHGFEDIKSNFTKIRYLHWHGYPFEYLLSNFHLKNLVALSLLHSNIKQLWNGFQCLDKLKYINLSHSKHLTESPDLSQTPKLESLILEGCTSLNEIHSSIQCLNELATLNLKDCKNLTCLPNCIRLKSLRSLILSGCSNLDKFPEIPHNLEELFLNGTAIDNIPSSIHFLSRLVVLDFENCYRLRTLSDNICKLKSLEYLNVSGCLNIRRLPRDLGNLEALKVLKASGIGKGEETSTSSSVSPLNNLNDPDTIGFSFPSLSGFRSLTHLHLNDCGITELPDDLGQLSALKFLYLRRNHFSKIPASIKELTSLYWLSISNCERLQSLPVLPCDLELEAHNCTSLQKLSGLSTLYAPYPWMRQAINFINCLQLDDNALRLLVDYALMKIPLMASALLRGLKGTILPNACISFPGSEIPRLLHFQESMGSSITLELQDGWFNKKFVGFALVVVVEFQGQQHHNIVNRGLMVGCKCRLKAGDGVYHVTSGALIGWDSDQGPRFLEKDHVFIGYDFNLYPFNSAQEYPYSNVVSFEFHLQDNQGQRLEYYKVKKCGVRSLQAEYDQVTRMTNITW